MVGFIIGLFVGGFLGVFVMCLCNMASRADNNIEQMNINKEKESENNGVKDAEGLLLDAYEQRMCA